MNIPYLVTLLGKISRDTHSNNLTELKTYYNDVLSPEEKQVFEDFKDFALSVVTFKIEALVFSRDDLK